MMEAVKKFFGPNGICPIHAGKYVSQEDLEGGDGSAESLKKLVEREEKIFQRNEDVEQNSKRE